MSALVSERPGSGKFCEPIEVRSRPIEKYRADYYVHPSTAQFGGITKRGIGRQKPFRDTKKVYRDGRVSLQYPAK